MRSKLPVALAAVLSLTITADAAGAGYATRTLQIGSSGSDVRALQRYLDQAATTRPPMAPSGRPPGAA